MIHFEYLSLIVIIPALLHGAYNDIKTRTAPKIIWKYIAPFGIFLTLLWYIYNFYWNGFNTVLLPFIFSMILCPFCTIMAYRMGNGGDWRALFWICLITPWVAPITLVLSCIIGLVQTGIDHFRKAERKSAWMVSITAAYLIAGAAYVTQSMGYW